MSIWVTLGIVGIVALVHFIGGRARVRLVGGADMQAARVRAYPDDRACGALLVPEGFAPLPGLEGNRIGLLWAMGRGRVLFISGVNPVCQFWNHTETIRRPPRWFEPLTNTPRHRRMNHGCSDTTEDIRARHAP